MKLKGFSTWITCQLALRKEGEVNTRIGYWTWFGEFGKTALSEKSFRIVSYILAFGI